jgi:transglutaminase-like putative cysteine protease
MRSPALHTRRVSAVRRFFGNPSTFTPAPASVARAARIIARLRCAVGTLRAFAANRSGATMILVALSLPVLVGAMGLSAEVSY